jgi:uncharacterized protein
MTPLWCVERITQNLFQKLLCSERIKKEVTMNPATPTQPNERVEVIDILRGFALFGILMVNMMYFAWPVYTEVVGTPWTHPLDRAASWFVSFFAAGKFFTLFSFLFGLGLAVQMQRAEAKGVAIVPLYMRRLFILLLIGIAHVVLLWWGDILIYYALLGFVLLLFRNTKPRRLLIWALVFLIVPLLLNAAFTGLTRLADDSGQIASVETLEAQFQESYALALTTYQSGNFAAMIEQRVGDYAFTLLGQTFGGTLFIVLAMFLLGLYVGKRRLLQNVNEHLPFFKKVFVWAGVLGLGGTTLEHLFLSSVSPLEPTFMGLLGLAGFVVGAPALSLCYASGLVLLAQRVKQLNVLASLGRTALSNYLLQSLICTTLFYGYGFGLYGKVGPALGIGITVAIFALQIPLSHWWLRHFRFGLAEWLWRTLTYGKIQPMRLSETNTFQRSRQ